MNVQLAIKEADASWLHTLICETIIDGLADAAAVLFPEFAFVDFAAEWDLQILCEKGLDYLSSGYVGHSNAKPMIAAS